MSIQPLYRDFFKFLDRLSAGDDPWISYQESYLTPHLDFLKSYWQTFHHMSPEQIAGRVGRIKTGDYGLLQSLIVSQNPESLAGEAIRRCQSTLPLSPEPPVYLFVGFFSADGMRIDLAGGPVIAIALERFQDFKDLPLLVAHEYGHCLRPDGTPDFSGENKEILAVKIMREGLAVLFTELVYPEVPLARHLFLTPERSYWCQDNREALLDLAGANLASAGLVSIFFGSGDPDAGIPPRVGYYVAREMVRAHWKQDDSKINPKAGLELIHRLRRLPDGPEAIFPA